jgi:hypothetical protein
VMNGAVAQDRITKLIDEFGRAVDDESALAQRLDDIRSRKARLDHQLLEAREEASRSALAASRRESELLVETAKERLRMAELDVAEQLVRVGAERRVLVSVQSGSSPTRNEACASGQGDLATNQASHVADLRHFDDR